MTPDERTQRMKTLQEALWTSVCYNKGDWWTLLDAYTSEVERGVWEEAAQVCEAKKYAPLREAMTILAAQCHQRAKGVK